MIYSYKEIQNNYTLINYCGGKGMNLVKLKQAGFSVPNFILIPHKTISRELKRVKSDFTFDTKLLDKEIQSKSEEIKKEITETYLSEAFTTSLSENIERNFDSNCVFAVRSSALEEDGLSDSFAGMFDSYLFVEKNQLIEKIKQCIASIFNAHVIKYKQLKNISLSTFNIAIVIQEMVHSEQSGVIFTMNPDGNLNELLICAAYGQGEGVVQGTSKTDCYYLDRNTLQIREIIATKNNPRNNPRNKNQQKKVLNKKELEKLFLHAKEIEKLFKVPQDIEFAIDKSGSIQFLQSRAITTINLKELKILDNTNIVESYPGISLPLTFSLAKNGYKQTLISTAKCLKLSDKEINSLSSIFPNLIAHVKGRIYYNLHHWYTMVQKIIMSENDLQSWEEFIGIKNRVTSFKRVSILKKINRVWLLLRLFLKHDNNCNQFFSNFENAQTSFKSYLAKESHNKSANDLFQFYETESNKWLSFWGITLINDFFLNLSYSSFKKLVLTYGFEKDSNITNDLLCGINGVDSEKPILELFAIKELINQNPKLKKVFENTPHKILNYIKRNDSNAFSILFFKYIEEYGDRTLEELKMESASFRSDPIQFVELIKNILENKSSASSFKSNQKSIRSKAESKIFRKQNQYSIKTLWYKCLLKQTKKLIRNRENMRFCRTKAYGLVKQLFLKIGGEMERQRHIQHKRDIFYLNLSEIRDYCFLPYGTDKKKDIEYTKQVYSDYKKTKIPGRIIYLGAHLPDFSNYDRTAFLQKECLKGIPITKGIINGEALILDHPKVNINIDNNILVSKATDPGWVFLMAQAKGIISENGSPLSHTAIIGRELGIPTIVNVPGATTVIKNGQKIEMNGHKGIVKLA
jgi:pyruvate,water dikinase